MAVVVCPLTLNSDLLGSAAFSVVQNDLKGNITVRSRSKVLFSPLNQLSNIRKFARVMMLHHLCRRLLNSL